MEQNRFGNEILKIKPSPLYPPEEGHYLRGNDYSPVAVVAMLNAPYENIPVEVEKLVRVSIETGAALAGTLQTENIGLEKIICNLVANPNIRYLVICGTEVEGHYSGDALRALIENGIDDRRTIIGSKAKTPYLFNIPLEAIESVRKQISLVDLLMVTDSEVIEEAIRACYQEQPTQFQEYKLYDPGAFPEPPICSRITWRIKRPETVEEWEIEDIIKEELK